MEKTLIISSASAVISPSIVGTMISPVSIRVISEVGACGTSESTSGVQEETGSGAGESEEDAGVSDSDCGTSEGTSGVQEGAGSGAGASAGALGTSTEILPPSS